VEPGQTVLALRQQGPLPRPLGRTAPLKTYDVAVVGLGIAGASALYALTRAGARVLALDAGVPGRGTSFTSFAWTNAVRKEPEAYHRLNAAGMVAHRALARELGGDPAYYELGSLEWAAAGEKDGELRARVERLRQWGYAAEFITRGAALKLEPNLAIPETTRDVAFFAEDGWIDAGRTIRKLIDASQGADVRERTAVRSMRVAGGRIEELAIDNGDACSESFVAAGSVLVCAGPSTQEFLAPLGVRIPVDRVPGLLAITSKLSRRLDRVIHAPGVHIRPDEDGGLRIGADDVDEPASKGSPADVRKLAEMLLDRAGGVFPAARDVTLVDHRIGVRPMPGDKHTIAGRIPGFENAYMLATHSAITLGPLLGRLMADEIVRGAQSVMLAPFRPDRFK
jgi:glycine/D-amino acid oxidase-like deaminating enzyme